MNPEAIKRELDRVAQNTETLYGQVLRGPTPLQLETEKQLEKEILDAVTNSKFTKLNLGQIARWSGVHIEVVESIAQQVVQTHLGADLEQLEFESAIKQIQQLEQIQDVGMREWKLQGLARRLRRTPRQLMEAYNKALCQQAPVQPLHISEFKKKHQKEIDWLVQGWIPKGVTLLLHADGGVGKTLLVYQLLECVLAGKPWNDYQVEQGDALLVQVDEPELITAERLDIRGISDDAPLYILSDWQVENIANLENRIAETRPKLLVIDSITAINRNSIFSENDTEYARPILQIRDLARRYGCTIILIHHSNAGGESRGTRAIHNSVDEVWGLSIADNQDRLLRVQKTRLGRPPGRYKFSFEEDFSFHYKGEDLPGDDSDDDTQEGRIRLWLSDDPQRGTAYAPVEVSESLGIGREATRRALYELWAKGLIDRKRPPASPYYLYFVKKKHESDREFKSDRAKAIGVNTSEDKGLMPTDRAIAQKTEKFTIKNDIFFRSPDRSQQIAQENQDFGGDRNAIDHSDRRRSEGVLIENSPPPESNTSLPVATGSKVKKRGKKGWIGRVHQLTHDGAALVLWTGDKRPIRELLPDLEVVSDGA